MQKVSQLAATPLWPLYARRPYLFVNDVSIIFIDRIDPTDPLKREQYWRHTLKIFVPYGLNISEGVWLHNICKLL